MVLRCFTWNIDDRRPSIRRPCLRSDRRLGESLTRRARAGRMAPASSRAAIVALRLRCVPPNPSWDAWNLTKLVAQRMGESTA